MPVDKPTIPDVLPLVREIYATHAAGGHLHIVLDDGNVEDESVSHCVDFAKEEGCELCLETAEMLAKMSETQRWKLYRMRHPIFVEPSMGRRCVNAS